MCVNPPLSVMHACMTRIQPALSSSTDHDSRIAIHVPSASSLDREKTLSDTLYRVSRLWSKIHILFLRAYAWNDEIFFCLLRFTNNVWISSWHRAGSHRSVEESIEWPSHLLLDLSPLAVHPLPNPSYMYSTWRDGRYRGRDGLWGRANRSWEVTLWPVY